MLAAALSKCTRGMLLDVAHLHARGIRTSWIDALGLIAHMSLLCGRVAMHAACTRSKMAALHLMGWPAADLLI